MSGAYYKFLLIASTIVIFVVSKERWQLKERWQRVKTCHELVATKHDFLRVYSLKKGIFGWMLC